MSMTFATDVIINNGYTLNDARIFYGTIGSTSTDASATTKTVVCSNFKSTDLVKGVALFVNVGITNTGAVDSLKFNVNSTGEKVVKCLLNGTLANLPSASYLLGDETYLFFYDGTSWVTTVNRDNNDNSKVTQTNRATNATYNVLFSVDTNTTSTKTNSTYKSANLTFNPSSGLLTASGDVNSHGKPCIYGQYSASSAPSSPVTGQLWLKDAGMTVEEAKVLVISTGTISSLPKTISNASITDDMEVIKSEWGNPNVQEGDVMVTTSNGSITISGSISDSTTLRLWLLRSR